jgi:hypothetical protein
MPHVVLRYAAHPKPWHTRKVGEGAPVTVVGHHSVMKTAVLQFSTRRRVIWKIESLKTSGIESQAIKSVWVKSKACSWFHIPISLLRTPGITVPLVEPILGGPVGGERLNGFVFRANCGRLGANAAGLRGRIRDPTICLCRHDSGDRGSTKEVDA